MVDFKYGPVELYLVGFEGERPSPGVVGALADRVPDLLAVRPQLGVLPRAVQPHRRRIDTGPPEGWGR